MTPLDSDALVVEAAEGSGAAAYLAISLAAAPDGCGGVLGPNGSGKSTLLSAVAGLTPVSAGCTTLGGRVMDNADTGTFVEASGRPVGFVFQDTGSSRT